MSKTTLYIDEAEHIKLKIASAKSGKSQTEIINNLLKSNTEQQLIDMCKEDNIDNKQIFSDEK